MITNIRFFSAVLIIVLSSLASANLPELKDASHYQATTIKIISLLKDEHYRDMKLDDALSTDLFNSYINNLDPGKMFFLKTDIDDFSVYKTKLDDLLKQGDNKAAFIIYDRFRERLIERLSFAINLLNNDNFLFDFTREESIHIGDKDSWHANKSQAEDAWRKRLKSSLLAQKLSGEDVADARKQLLKNYTNQLDRIRRQTSEDVYEVYINSFTELYDPHTSYMSPRVTKNFYINMSLSLEGIGAVLQTEDEYTKVLRIVGGGPASKQGELKPADKIIGVAQGNKDMVNVVGWRLDDVVDLIRGDKGTTVRLSVVSGDGPDALPRTIAIVRDKIELEDQDAQKATFEIKGQHKTYRIGVISLPAFYLDFEAIRRNESNVKSTSKDVKKLIQELVSENVDGIILDLRNNGGGALSEATALTDLFIDRGPVVQIRKAGSLFGGVERSYSPAYYRGPMVVLVNRLSASASEILAGALQDYNRAIIVGSQSFGKGTVQTIKDLGEYEKLKVTESKFYRVSGESTQHRGVIPDILMPEVIDTEKVGENTYQSALPWDTISPAAYRPYQRVNSIIEALKKAHQDRIATDPDFVFIQEQSALADEIDKKQELSLNEEVRIREQKALESRTLSIANKKRVSKGEEPYKSIEELREADKKRQEKLQQNANTTVIDTKDDAILREAGLILADFIDITSGKLADSR